MSPFNILVATDLTEESIHILEEIEDMDLHVVTPSLPALRTGLKTAQAIIARDDVLLDKAALDGAPELKVIGRVGAALNGIDIDEATGRGIIVMNTPGTSAIAAGEHTITLMLALSRKLVVTHNSLKDGWWLLDRKRQAGTQLYGKTLGIVGLGRTGRVVAQRCLAFGMTVLANDPYLSEEQVDDDRIALVGLNELLATSDFITLHIPATRETHKLFTADLIAQIKPGARLINTAFGAVWDEAAVAQALHDGHLAGVAVDVYDDEPPYNSPLVGLDNVIHTPHIAENTVEATQDLSLQIVNQVVDALREADYRNAVNLPFMAGADYDTIRPFLLLAERIGMLSQAMARNPIQQVAIELRGEEVSGLVKPLTVALLKGLLTPVLGDKVSYINAPLLASERGLQVTQTKGLKIGHYTNLVLCQVRMEDGDEMAMAGMLIDHSEPHIVQINDYRMNFVPQGHLLIMGSYDKPGVIGKVGMLMANNNINIASWQTGRADPGGQTLTVLTFDEPVPDAVLDELRAQDFVRHAHCIEI